jgi:hypothetical protein
MPLFSDGPASTIEDLLNQDSGLIDVCKAEQIDAGMKLRVAMDDIAGELEALFESQRSVYTPYFSQPQLNLRHLAVTSSLKRWHTFQTLAMIYRDAYFSQLNDRFQAKWQEFQRLAQVARNQLREIGVGLVLCPLPRPASPLLTTTPATETGGSFYVAVTLLNSQGEESAPSLTAFIDAPTGNAIGAQLSTVPENAAGWNAYVGSSPSSLVLQNNTPIAAPDAWVFYPSAALVTGQRPGDGQKPNLIRGLPRLLQRG